MDLTRQQDLVDDRTLNLVPAIIGAGGIGSFTAYALVKMGIEELVVIDPDEVEAHNIPNQMYMPTDVGSPKVGALSANLKWAIGTEHFPISFRSQYKVTDLQDIPSHDLVILAVDSMATRKALFETRNPDKWFIDARMGAETAWVLTVEPGGDTSFYRSKLYSDEEGFQEPCTARATIYCALGIASVVAALVRRIAQDDDVPPEVILDYEVLGMVATEQVKGGEL